MFYAHDIGTCQEHNIVCDTDHLYAVQSLEKIKRVRSPKAERRSTMNGLLVVYDWQYPGQNSPRTKLKGTYGLSLSGLQDY